MRAKHTKESGWAIDEVKPVKLNKNYEKGYKDGYQAGLEETAKRYAAQAFAVEARDKQKQSTLELVKAATNLTSVTGQSLEAIARLLDNAKVYGG